MSRDEKISPQNLAGYIIHAGKPPKDQQVLKAYQERLGKYGVGLATSDKGDAEDVVKVARNLVNKHGL